MTKEELIDILKAYLNHIRDAVDNFIVYDSFCKAYKDYIDFINLSPGFFHISIIACLNCFELELCKLFDTGMGSERTILKLIRIVEGNAGLFPSLVNSSVCLDSEKVEQLKGLYNVDDEILMAKKFIEDNKEIIDKLSGRRDQYFAHNDPKYFLNADMLMKDYPITFEEAKKLLRFAEEFCNSLLGALANERIICASENANDLKCLLANVRL